MLTSLEHIESKELTIENSKERFGLFGLIWDKGESCGYLGLSTFLGTFRTKKVYRFLTVNDDGNMDKVIEPELKFYSTTNVTTNMTAIYVAFQ